MNTPPELDYFTKFAMADCAARALQSLRPSPNISDPQFCGLRSFARSNAICALRWLWKNGDHMDRHMVAARILIWLNTPEPRKQHVLTRLKTTPNR